MPLNRWLLLAILAMTVMVYAPGLNGPFLFDDHVHITQNRWVKIDELSWDNLAQAWNSSFSSFPTNRPLAQLSFGLNHVAAGLSPWAFKTTDLLIHLLAGLVVYLLSSLLYRATTRGVGDRRRETLFALLVTAFWLLTPLQVSTVLYSVQRMSQISALAMLLALSSYVWGRLRIHQGRTGALWLFMTIPLAAIGFLGKENTVILPLLLLVTEITLLRGLSYQNGRRAVHLAWGLLIALPLIAGAVYLLRHPEYIDYSNRHFTMEERVLSQPRILLIYLRQLLMPDIGLFGLYHDDLELSSGLLSPPTTLWAILVIAVAAVAALTMRNRMPMFAFAVLFFLAGHSLESSLLPLEPMFEHRNYLAILGPLALIAYLVVIVEVGGRRSIGLVLALLLLASHGVATVSRVGNWKSHESFVLAAAENHPKSPRSNFLAGQFLIAATANGGDAREQFGRAAADFLNQGLDADPACLNCLFGLLVLDLHLGRQPSEDLVDRLSDKLRSGEVDATKISVGQFSYLTKWHRSDGTKLPAAQMKRIFEAALANPKWLPTGRAGVAAAYRDYHEYVLGDLPGALDYAEHAVEAWPAQWSYHMQKIRVLRKLGRYELIPAALDRARTVAKHRSQIENIAQVAQKVAADLQGPNG